MPSSSFPLRLGNPQTWQPVQPQKSPQKASHTSAHSAPGYLQGSGTLESCTVAIPGAVAGLGGPCAHQCGQPWSTCVAQDHCRQPHDEPLATSRAQEPMHTAPFSAQGYQSSTGTLAHTSMMISNVSRRLGDPCTQKCIQPRCTGEIWGP